MNVPSPVEAAAREGLILIVSNSMGQTHRWRSRLTDAGFLLTQENGLRYLLPILCCCKSRIVLPSDKHDGYGGQLKHQKQCRAQMIPEDLLPYLQHLYAAVHFWIDRGEAFKATYWATRLVSVVHENPDTRAGWFDPEKVKTAYANIEQREAAKVEEASR